MEKIYKVNSSDLINIREEFEKFKKDLLPSNVEQPPKTEDDIKKLINFTGTEEEYETLNDLISIENLTQANEIKITDFQIHQLHRKRDFAEIPEKALHLNCLAPLLEDQGNTRKSSRHKRGNKFNKYKFLKIDVDNSVGECDLKPLDDIFIVIRVYEPFIYFRGEQVVRKPRLSQELVVIGTQLLTELRDKIYCQCRFGPFYDISNDYDAIANLDPDTPLNSAAEDPGFFFITDTFYKDTRQVGVDYTKEIQEWMIRQPDIGEVKVKTMQNTQFIDLTLRMGFPQVYKHYGNCEHLIVFYDMRLLTPDDPLQRSNYPMLRMVSSSKCKICMICGTMEACFVVKNSTAHIHEKTFLCKNCFMLYHYVNGEKIGEFQAYRYYGNRPVPT